MVRQAAQLTRFANNPDITAKPCAQGLPVQSAPPRRTASGTTPGAALVTQGVMAMKSAAEKNAELAQKMIEFVPTDDSQLVRV